MVDTVKAIAHVVSEKIDEAVENFNAPEAPKPAATPEEKTAEAPAAEPAKAADVTTPSEEEE